MLSLDYDLSSSQRRRSREHFTSTCSGNKSMNSRRWSMEQHEDSGNGYQSGRNTTLDGYQNLSPSRRKHYSVRESDLFSDERLRMPYPDKQSSSSPARHPLSAYCARRRPSDYRRSHSPVNHHSPTTDYFMQKKARTNFSPSERHLSHFDVEKDFWQPHNWRSSTADMDSNLDVPRYHRSRSPYPSSGCSRTINCDRDPYAISDYSRHGRSISPPLERNGSPLRSYDKYDYQCYHRARSRTPPRNQDTTSCTEWTSISNRRDSHIERTLSHHKSQDFLDR